MTRLLGLSALVLLAATGCRMCACPYDYCGPVVECDCAGGEGCGMNQGPVEGQIEDGAPSERRNDSARRSPSSANSGERTDELQPTHGTDAGGSRVNHQGPGTRCN